MDLDARRVDLRSGVGEGRETMIRRQKKRYGPAQLLAITGMIAVVGVAHATAPDRQAAGGTTDPAPTPAPSVDAAPPRDRPVRLPARPVQVPFVLQDNLVRIEASIDGKRQQVVLDSGAAATIVDQAFARAHGLIEGRSVGDAAGAGATAQALRPVRFSSLAVGPLRFEQLDAYSVDLSHLSASAGFPVNLLIGAPAFKYGAVTVDYPRRRVTFGPSGSAEKCAAPIPLAIVDDAPIVEVQLRPTPGAAPVRLRLLVDLGTRHAALTIGGPFLRTDAGAAMMRSGVARQVGHGIGGKVQGSVARVDELRIGPSTLRKLDVSLTSGVPAFETGVVDGSLGVPFWQSGAITFDYPARTLCITAANGRDRVG
ncbi:aspartyl protease family protein [Sphingomonas sp. 1P08PE]|uniref:aspartyl protease family protein n=1 Tax=Sphingomonas sp. 1P08PE TaxID=554122 RepID=UPI0039A0867B